jgi:hypothetical protein
LDNEVLEVLKEIRDKMREMNRKFDNIEEDVSEIRIERVRALSICPRVTMLFFLLRS